MTLASGARLGHYEILSALGAGGMGEVYRARDTKLHRDVAIKVLLGAVANDSDRLARFSREAQVLAALNHPNIAHIHGLEESGGVPALVLELVEGPTLADRLEQGPIPVGEVLPIARQIAEALEAAHEQAIVHRDLKPANIKVRPDGTVKVLDFGLAKALDQSSGAGPQVTGPLTQSPTITSPAQLTGVGIILGTAAYMSPEQARGRAVDRRSDIWAFGVVLFEMLTGTRAFSGEDISATLALILARDPNWSALPANVPASIHKLLHRCLEKDPKRRLQAIGDARLEIEEAMTAPAIDTSIRRVADQPTTWRRVLPWIVSSALALTVVLLLWNPWRAPILALSTVQFQIPLPTGTSSATMFSFSPDGRHLAFIAGAGGRPQLWVRDMDTLESRRLAGTDGATYPFWSPDDSYVGFFAQSKLKKIAIAGGTAQTLCDASDGRGGTWNSTGVIVFSAGPASPLLRVSAAGGEPAPVTILREGDTAPGHRFPTFLPDGVHLLYTVSSDKPEAGGLYLGALDGAMSTRLLSDNTNGLFAPTATRGGTGNLIFRHENTLMAQPFDLKTLRSVGEMRPVAEDVPDGGNRGFGAFSVSESGTLAYRAGAGVSNRALVWMDRAGKRLGGVAAPGAFGFGLRLSPDEATLAISVFSGSLNYLWLQDLKRDVVMSRFTFLPGKSPVWSPDGKSLAFVRQYLGPADIYQKATAGGGQETLLLHAGLNANVLDWSPDGRWILYQQQELKTGVDLWLLPLDGDRKPVPYLQTPFNESFAAFSPDAHWIAYQSDESGQSQIYLQTMPAAGAKYQISNGGGTRPEWRRDGKELFYVSTDGTLMAVPITLGERVESGTPHTLFAGIEGTDYVSSRDGQRFLVNVPAGGDSGAVQPITVVLNWTAGLKP